MAGVVELARSGEASFTKDPRVGPWVTVIRTDDAFAALEEGYQSRAEWISYLKVDPQMDTLRRDPRYTSLLKRLNL